MTFLMKQIISLEWNMAEYIIIKILLPTGQRDTVRSANERDGVRRRATVRDGARPTGVRSATVRDTARRYATERDGAHGMCISTVTQRDGA